MKHKVTANIGGKDYTIECGHMAKQADGAIIIRGGETLVLVTVVSSKEAKEGIDFLPLTVDYQEKNYAAGKIPGGFFKREGKPTDKETLTSRLIDRPLRPLFPEGYNFETQVIAQVISSDPDWESDVMALTGASAALGVSNIPFAKLVAGCRVARVNGDFIINPDRQMLEKSDLEVIVAGTEEAIVMVEGGALEVSESDMIDALDFGHRHIKDFIGFQKELIGKINPQKRTFETKSLESAYHDKIKEKALTGILECFSVKGKLNRNVKMKEFRNKVCEELVSSVPDEEKEGAIEIYKKAFHDLQYDAMREMIIEDGKRIDGRSSTDIREITCEVGILPRAHGSALFTRGETQALVTATLGTKEDEQRVESLAGSYFKRLLLHYNFPPFSVGEVKPLRGPGRREIGHGKLAERAIEKVIPGQTQEFPYTIRLVSDILESNGSSSMATVCGSSLALMDAGVPIRSHVAGIAMGLIKENEKVAILSDILGDEDHLGDMDFKVCGTRQGITSIQMDIKIEGVTREIMNQALHQAQEGRIQILDKMEQAISTPRSEFSPYAPRTMVMNIKPERIKDVIGSGGKIIRSIIEETGVKIDIEDSGKVVLFSSDPANLEKAQEIIKGLTADPELGMVYNGKVKKIMDFGAFVEILPGTEGLVHISQLANERVNSVEDVVKEGDEFPVKVLEIDRQGKIRLSRKEAIGKEIGTIHPVKEGSFSRPNASGGRRPPRDRNSRPPKRRQKF